MGCNWVTPKTVSLPGRERVHIWCTELDSYGQQSQADAHILEASELERANRFHFTGDRAKFILRRVVLRKLLGYYLRIDPCDIRYKTNESGKLALDEQFNSNLQFTLSVSGELALIACAEERQIGIDLEKVRTGVDVILIAERFFSSREASILSSLPAGQQIQGFYNCWTRKEAVVKALGRGLSLALDSFDVSLTPGEPARILDAREAALEALRLTLQDIAPADGYTAALAVEGLGWQAELWKFSDSVGSGC